MPSQSTATLRSRYAEQAASDLQENRRRQQELAEKMAVLKEEEALLVDILTLAERFGAPQDPAPLPLRARDEPDRAPTIPAARTAPAPAPAAAPGGDTSHRPARTTTAGPRSANSTPKSGPKGESRQPLLGDILMDLLSTHREPRLAKELRDELLEKYPERTPTPQVVRNTLEALVAKSRIQRHKQQRSVMYSLVEPSERKTARAAATPESDG